MALKTEFFSAHVFCTQTYAKCVIGQFLCNVRVQNVTSRPMADFHKLGIKRS